MTVNQTELKKWGKKLQEREQTATTKHGLPTLIDNAGRFS